MTSISTKTISEAQRRFADEFLKDFCATAAYVRAGYKARGKSAGAAASRLLAKPEVATYLSEKKQVLSEDSGLSLQRMVQELKAIALLDPRRLYDDAGLMLPPKEWPADVAAAISGIDVTELFETRDGKKVRTGQTRKLSLWNKLDAIEKGLKLLNAYPEKRVEGPRETIVGVVVIPAKAPYVDPRQGAIDAQSKRIEAPVRTDPLPPPTKKFVVPRVDQ